MGSQVNGVHLGDSVRDWYREAYPQDDFGALIREDLTFEGVIDALGCYKDIYESLGVTDSFIRENVFQKTARLAGVDYNVLYRRWLNQDGRQSAGPKKLLDCSIFGDRRFNGAFAELEINGEVQSIHDWYYQSRRLDDGSMAEPGKMFDHITDPFTGVDLPVEDASDLYRGLWIMYLQSKPELAHYASGFDDVIDSTYDVEARQRQVDAYNRDPFDPKTEFAYEHPEGMRGAEVIGALALGNREFYETAVKSGHWYKEKEAYKKKPIAEKVLEFLEQENPIFWYDQGHSNPGSREGCLQLITKDLMGGHQNWYIEEIRALGNSCFHLRSKARAIVNEMEAKKEPLSKKIEMARAKPTGFASEQKSIYREKDLMK